MKVCFAVQKDDSYESAVYDRFGSANAFIVVDTETGRAVTINNLDMNHVHGACDPIQAIGGLSIDALVVGGIGAGAIMKLQAQGIKVYRSAAATVKQNLSLLKEGKLPELSVRNACGRHQEGEGSCSH